MSHFSQMEVKIKDVECAIKALETMGCKGQLEVHETPRPLRDFQGLRTNYVYRDTKDPRFENGDCAHVILRQQHLGYYHNDLGIYVDGDASKLIVCDYTLGTCKDLGNPKARKLGSYRAWIARFKQEYAYEFAKKSYAKKGKIVHRVEDGKRIKLFVRA